MSFGYGQQTLATASPVELVVALYDGATRFLREAIRAVEENDTRARRLSIKRVLDIVLHLQSRLRHEHGPEVASALDQFYVDIFRQTLEASAANSREGLERVIAHVEEVRGAWKVAARDPQVGALG